MALGGKHPFYGRKASLIAFNPSAVYHGRPHMTTPQIRRVTKRVNRQLGSTAVHFPHLHEPRIAGLTPHIPKPHIRDPIHLRLHPTASLGSGIAHDIKKVGGSIERDVRKIERKVI